MPWKCPSCGYEPIPDDVSTCPVCGFVREAEVKPKPEVPKPQPPPEAKAPPPPPSLQPPEKEEVPPPTPPTIKARIAIVQTPVPELKGRELELPFDVFPVINIGRHPENVVCIPDPYISRFHAKIYYEEGKFLIEDVGSTNGTYIYDKGSGTFKKIEPNKKVEIGNGALIKLGISTIVKFITE